MKYLPKRELVVGRCSGRLILFTIHDWWLSGYRGVIIHNKVKNVHVGKMSCPTNSVGSNKKKALNEWKKES